MKCSPVRLEGDRKDFRRLLDLRRRVGDGSALALPYPYDARRGLVEALYESKRGGGD